MIDHEQIKRNNRKTLILIIALVLMAACLLVLGIWQALKRPEMSKTQVAPELGQMTGTLANGKELLLKSDSGISVYIFGCPTQVNGNVVMTPMGPYTNEEVAADNIWTRPSTVNVSFTTESNKVSAQFSELCTVRVCFVLNDEQWKHYEITPEDLGVHFLETEAETKAFWSPLFAYSVISTKDLCADYHRLGLYALAVKNLPAPVTGGLYEPGQISITATPTEPGLYEP